MTGKVALAVLSLLLACAVGTRSGDGQAIRVGKRDPKCCKCNSGIVIYSGSGSCSTCKGEIADTRPPPPGCRKGEARTRAQGKECGNKCPAVMEADLPEDDGFGDDGGDDGFGDSGDGDDGLDDLGDADGDDGFGEEDGDFDLFED